MWELRPPTIALVFAASLAVWLLGAALGLFASPPLGHDEARYAIAAQDLLAGVPARWDYSSIGMNAIALPGVLLGGGEIVLRIVPTLLGVVFLLAALGLARDVLGSDTSAWTIGVLAGSFAFVRRAAELLSDLPATACLLAGIGILLQELTREAGPRRSLWFAAPWLATAFYLRYGSILAIAAIAGAALVAGWPAVRRRPRIALWTAGLLVILLVPHGIDSYASTGSPLGILRMSSGVIGANADGPSLLTYLTSNPVAYYGLITAPVMLAGLVAIRRGRDLRIRLLWLIAVLDIAIVGLTPIAQPRYIFLGVTLLVILGVDEIHGWVMARGPAARNALGWLCIAAVTAGWIHVLIGMGLNASRREEQTAGTRAAAAAIRRDAAGAPCQVVGRASTQLQWYSGCAAVSTFAPDTLSEQRVYLVYVPGEGYQPERAGRPGVPRPILERADAIVTRYDPSP